MENVAHQAACTTCRLPFDHAVHFGGSTDSVDPHQATTDGTILSLAAWRAANPRRTAADRRLEEAAERAGLTPLPEPREDLLETIDRSRAVMRILETLHEELTRLEIIPSQDADDVNALSAARGFVARARNILRGRFQ